MVREVSEDSFRQPQSVAPTMQACLPCKKQKRKCDKGQPNCALCKRIGRICRYESSQISDADSELSGTAPSRLSFVEQYSSSAIKQSITKQILAVVGDEGNIRTFSGKYFKTIHTWFPVISQSRYLKRLPLLCSNPSPGFALLSLCMLLVVTAPEAGVLSTWSQSIYTLIKSAIGALDGSGVELLDLLQCRLLATVFEVGHGQYPAAYISIGTVTRVGVAMGIHEGSYGSRSEEAVLANADESRMIWRGILILDRYISLEHGNGPCSTKGVAAGERSSEEAENGNRNDHRQLSETPKQQFKRLAEAADLLDKVLLHVHDPTPHQDFNGSEALQLMMTINSFRILLREELGEKARICNMPAVAICNSALLVLYEYGNTMGQTQPVGESTCAEYALTFLESVIEEVLQITDYFKESLPVIDLEAIPPFLPHSIYKAAVLLNLHLKLSQGFDPLRALSSLTSILHLLRGRWLAAERYLQLLDDTLTT